MEQYIVTGMSCAACAARVEKAVSAVAEAVRRGNQNGQPVSQAFLREGTVQGHSWLHSPIHY